MIMTLQQIEADLLKLEPSARAMLAEKLLQSLEALTDEEIEKLWVAEALRRHEELETGKASSKPAEDVFRDARKRIG
jgi:putative addiction module component (TIGR02574 family)